VNRLTSQLKAAELKVASTPTVSGANATSNPRVIQLEAEVSALTSQLRKYQSSALKSEVDTRPVQEWTPGAVAYYVESVFALQHQIQNSQLSEMLAELRRRMSTSEVVTGTRFSTFKLRDLRALKLTDIDTADLLLEAIDTLKLKAAANAATATAAAAGTVITPTARRRCIESGS